MEVKHWEKALPTALHSIRCLLSTATNMTPHERFLKHSRRGMYGLSLPSWLTNGNSRVLLKKHVRASKYDPLVDEVELLEANHQYAHIRHPDGRESTVSTHDLAPAGDTPEDDTRAVPCQMNQPGIDPPTDPPNDPLIDPLTDPPANDTLAEANTNATPACYTTPFVDLNIPAECRISGVPNNNNVL